MLPLVGGTNATNAKSPCTRPLLVPACLFDRKVGFSRQQTLSLSLQFGPQATQTVAKNQRWEKCTQHWCVVCFPHEKHALGIRGRSSSLRWFPGLVNARDGLCSFVH